VVVGNQCVGDFAESIFRVKVRGQGDISTALLLSHRETFVSNPHTARRDNPQNSVFYFHRRENLKSHKSAIVRLYDNLNKGEAHAPRIGSGVSRATPAESRRIPPRRVAPRHFARLSPAPSSISLARNPQD